MSDAHERVTGEAHVNHGPLPSCPKDEMHRLEDCTAEVPAEVEPPWLKEYEAWLADMEAQIQGTVESERLTAEDLGVRINCVD